MDPLACHLLQRSIKTLDVRVQRQNENAFAVAQFLESHRLAVPGTTTRVLYPGLASHPAHTLAATQMRGFGGMLSLELGPNLPVREFLKSLDVITPAMSLGGVDSTISVPAFTSHMAMSEQERRACGVTPNLLRVSVGIEDKRDLIADLTQAFANCRRER